MVSPKSDDEAVIQDLDLLTQSNSSPENDECRQHFDESGSHNSNSDPSFSESQSSSNGSGRATCTSDKLDHLFIKDGLVALAGARCCFIFTLFMAASVMAAVVYISLTDSQTGDFQQEFESAAVAVIKGSDENVRRIFSAMESLSLTSTTFIEQQQNVTYPDGFVTIPNVEYHLGNARKAAEAVLLGYTPQVQGTQEHELWLQYVRENIGWVKEAYDVNPARPPVGAASDLTYNQDFFHTNVWKNRQYLDGEPMIVNDTTYFQCSARASPDLDIIHYEYEVENPSNIVPLTPIWMASPPPNPDSTKSTTNFNFMSIPSFRLAAKTMIETKKSTFEDICDDPATLFHPNAAAHQGLTELYTLVTVPAWNHYGRRALMVGYFFAIVPWRIYFSDILDGFATDPVVVVMSNSCSGKSFSYQVIGGDATLLDPTRGVQFEHADYEGMALTAPFAEAFVKDPDDETGGETPSSNCISNDFTITVYPTAQFEDWYRNNEPLLFTLGVLAIFSFAAIAFLIFDWLSSRRQKGLVNTAMRQNALVSSLFPKNIQKKLMEEIEEDAVKNKTGKAGLRNYLNNETSEPQEKRRDVGKTKPIADLFPETTIMFADIAGFTAWSSTREPSQVFTLLETVYAEFDAAAKRRKVFKVEVVGDCYVAVSGLPDPRSDHALVMAKFANDCLNKMFCLVRKLEVELGPDTAELGLRIGLHSGPVVAGVLRGDKSRFQLFGDTMNTASRMESTGVPGKIQVSQDTADQLLAAGKEHWLKERGTKIAAKGKGELQTYFLQLDTHHSVHSSAGSVTSCDKVDDNNFVLDAAEVMERRNRVAEWTVEVMAQQLKAIIEIRKTQGVASDSASVMRQLEFDSLSQDSDRKTVINEVAECIKLPDYRDKTKGSHEVSLDATVMEELRGYVQTIATLYNDNPFHNFDHANHVVMSVNKLLGRITAPDLDECTAQAIHDHTFGITSDPLTWFACIFSALIHDVDHPGVPNAQLVKEGTPVAALYHGKSVAEQNSFDMAWDLLMEPSYDNLRKTIYVNSAEFRRFRQLVVNSVMATDIVDKDLKILRNNRWDAAFDENKMNCENRGRTLKATIIIEHLIQASDVAHTMQHWHIYRRWNESFFKECYQAYLDGRAEANPADTWYKGEIGFFDFYIIPLAKKLQSCGVFGVSSDEYLSYALQNRKEWEERGEDVVKEMILRNDRKYELAKRDSCGARS